ncbi:MAG: hypothetical protein KBS69_01545 [Bacteroidales bacterium]|nr:hypothetical protein [Candidatus Colicola caccequi]
MKQLTSQDILTYLPHRAPMVMVDSATIDGEQVTALLTITDTNWFANKGQLMEAGLIEHMAQSVAVCVKESHPQDAGHIGFLADVKDITINRLPNVGECIETQIALKAVVGEILLVIATTKVKQDIIASGELKIFLPQ